MQINNSGSTCARELQVASSVAQEQSAIAARVLSVTTDLTKDLQGFSSGKPKSNIVRAPSSSSSPLTRIPSSSSSPLLLTACSSPLMLAASSSPLTPAATAQRRDNETAPLRPLHDTAMVAGADSPRGKLASLSKSPRLVAGL